MRGEISALGLDIGRKRIGVAGCDRTGLIATGLTTLQQALFPELLRSLAEIAKERRAELLVVGLPLTLDGLEGRQAKQVRRMAERLSHGLQLPVIYVDERLTSVEAEDLIRQQGRYPGQDKALVDRKAAAIILQRWLDQR
ncbi:MAG: Holliday junction resolvase RuvX [Nodosilinea sp.]